MTSPLRTRLRSAPTRTRLLVLVLVPMIGLCYFAARDVYPTWRNAQLAQEVQQEAQLVQALADLNSAMSVELDRQSALAEAAGFGVDPSVLANWFGFDLAESAILAQAAVDDAWDRVAEAQADSSPWAAPEAVEQVMRNRSTLDRLRSDIGSGRATTDQVAEARGLLTDKVRAALAAELVELRLMQSELSGSSELGDAVRSTELVSLTDEAARDEFSAMFRYLFPVGDRGSDPEVARIELIRTTTIYDALQGSLIGSLSPELAQAFARRANEASWQDYEDLRTQAVTGQLSPFSQDANLMLLADLGSRMFDTGFTRRESLADFGIEVSQTVVSQAEDLEHAANRDLLASVGLMTCVIMATLVIASTTVRTVVGPISQLEKRANVILTGDLGQLRIAKRGPSDLMAVHGALDDLTESLQRIERQADALASGQLSDSVFDEAAPGQLGASLQASVGRLRELTRSLEHQASHDGLTGLPNRSAVLSDLDDFLTGEASRRRPVSVIMIDLDDFKQLNDALGHRVGDELLCHTADRLRDLSPDGIVGRLAGDEFMIIVEGSTTTMAAQRLGERVLDSLTRPFATSIGVIGLNASIGIASSDALTPLSPAEVLQRADVALGRAKSTDNCHLVIFDQRLHEDEIERARLQGELRVALKNDELTLFFQPIVQTSTGRVTGVEALLRWLPVGKPPIPPSVFIPAAEQSELITLIDDWVIDRACRHLSSWADDDRTAGLTMSINVSGRHMANDELPRTVERALRRSNADPGKLIVEVTETELIPNLEKAVQIFGQLRALGVRLAIDDFGTGYASVAHLRRVDFDRIKIDRSFVAAIDDATERSLGSLLVSLGRNLDLDVVAEGVETDEQLEWARSAGCTHIQGFLYARPVPVAELGAELERLRRPHRAVAPGR